ncbi:hypothetical protein Taro_010283 [Colocasia esculenta]|uniref:DUF641 domain-containing protein n=1 Tax=Colocasia esculenta TaxID=4460 RepID=A0A843U2M5_COLES|nr:hypothetical protein [Colocasia esculenta]
MLQKFALAVKTKTIEFFAEEDEEEEDQRVGIDLDSAEEVITGQRVLVIKPDNPSSVNGSKKLLAAVPAAPVMAQQLHQLHHGLVSSIFAAVSSFHAAYLNLQVAHEPLNADGVVAADRAAVSQLQRLSDLRRGYHHLLKEPNSGAAQGLNLSSHVEAQVQENQSMLRKFETVFNRLQADIDRKDAEVCALKEQLREVEASTFDLERKMGSLCTSASIEEGERFLLSIGVFDAILKEAYSAAHRFTKVLINLLKRSGWDLGAAANSIYPGTEFMKSAHHGYALLSYISLGMLGGFGSDGFRLENDETAPSIDFLGIGRREFFRQFVEQCSIDPMELLNAEPESDFARYCESKYHLLIHPGIESSLLGEHSIRDTMLGSWQPSSPLYEPFVSMSNFVWMLHKLALAFDRSVEIFQVQQGADFSMVYMENVAMKTTLSDLCIRRTRPKVGFTVFPGFRLGAAVIQLLSWRDLVVMSLSEIHILWDIFKFPRKENINFSTVSVFGLGHRVLAAFNASDYLAQLSPASHQGLTNTLVCTNGFS